MTVTPAAIPDVLLLAPQVFADARGFFVERWHARSFREATGLDVCFVQDNHSRSSYGVLRGLHYQLTRPQGKLVWVARGRIFDVAVDLRRSSPTFGRSVCVELSDDNHVQIWIPPGFAHGYAVLSDVVDVLYKATDFYSPADERTLAWDDPALAIPWPALAAPAPVLSSKDRAGVPLAAADTYA